MLAIVKGPDKTSDPFTMAEREGFEPSRGITPPYRFSKPAPSATWVPLHVLPCIIELLTGGEGGIRTHGTTCAAHRFSRAAPSTTRTPLQVPSMFYMVRPAGLEPATPATARRCSNPLSYGRTSSRTELAYHIWRLMKRVEGGLFYLL